MGDVERAETLGALQGLVELEQEVARRTADAVERCREAGADALEIAAVLCCSRASFYRRFPIRGAGTRAEPGETPSEASGLPAPVLFPDTMDDGAHARGSMHASGSGTAGRRKLAKRPS